MLQLIEKEFYFRQILRTKNMDKPTSHLILPSDFEQCLSKNGKHVSSDHEVQGFSLLPESEAMKIHITYRKSILRRIMRWKKE